MDFGGQRCDIDAWIVERLERGAHVLRRDGRQVALQVEHDLDLASGIELAKRLMDPVRAGGVVGAGHHRFAAMRVHGSGDFRRVGGNRDAADPGGFGPAQHMHDHRQPGNIQQAACPAAG